MKLGTIFRLNNYNEAYKYAINNNYTIEEIETDANGRRFKIVEIHKPNNIELSQIKLINLKQWFDSYYAQHEQKYRRLSALSLKCDDGQDPDKMLQSLYLEAEEKRKQIQELEVLINA